MQKHYIQGRSIIQLIRTASVRQFQRMDVIKDLDINRIKKKPGQRLQNRRAAYSACELYIMCAIRKMFREKARVIT